MKKYLLFISLILLGVACNNDDDFLPASTGPITVNTNPVVLDQVTFKIPDQFASNRWMILSDQQGEVLSCSQVAGDTLINVPGSILETEGGYNLSLGSVGTSDVIVDGGIPTFLNFTTYTNLKIPEINFQYEAPTPPLFTSNSPAVWVTMDVKEDEIDYVCFSSSIYTNSFYRNQKVRVYIADQTEDIFVLVKLKNEDNWRSGLFPQQMVGSTLIVKASELEEQAAQDIQIPAGSEIQWGGLTGIVQCEPEVRDFFIQVYDQFGNDRVETTYPQGIFERFETSLYLRKGNEDYEIIKMGEPLTEYLPDAPAFRVKNADPARFQLEPEADFTTYRTIFSSGQENEEQLNILSYVVWGEFSTDFRVPRLPDCIRDQFGWVSEEEGKLDLQSVAQYNYSTLNDYADFIGYQLSPDRIDSDCSRNNFNGEGTREIRTKKY